MLWYVSGRTERLSQCELAPGLPACGRHPDCHCQGTSIIILTIILMCENLPIRKQPQRIILLLRYTVLPTTLMCL